METFGERSHCGNRGGKIGWRAKISKTEHGAVALEQREMDIEQLPFEFGNRGRRARLWEGWCRIDRSKIAVLESPHVNYDSCLKY